jgi:hypothetical protein
MESKTSSQNKARMIVVSVFLVGFVAGALALNLYQRLTSSSPKAPEPGKVEFLIRKMDDRVGLTTDQETKVRAILEERSKKFGEIFREMEPQLKPFEPRFAAVREESRNQIRELLTDKQLSKYEDMLKEQDAAREKEKERRRN